MRHNIKKKIDEVKPQFEKGGKFEKLQSVFDGFYTFLFTPNETARSGVHIHDSNDSKRTMIIVVLALLPCCLFGMWNVGYQHALATGDADHSLFHLFFYGFWAVLPQILTAYIVGLGLEFIVAQLRGHEIQEGFLVSGILIPMICPVTTPCWMLAVAVAFAVIFAKEAFGGTGYNFLNVALVTRAFLFFAYPSKMSGDNVFVSLGGDKSIDGFSGATPLGQVATSEPGAVITGVNGDILSNADIFWGLIPGSWGETSTFCILIGAAVLLLTGMASWKIITSGLLGGLSMALIAHNFASPLYPVSYLSPLTQITLGGFLFAIVFMATDPVTSCRTSIGKWIYGFLVGAIAILIRCYNTGYPEGAMLAVLLMNCFAPLIDWCVVNSNIRRRMKRSLTR
ncbi:MAG: NADH:ubiquinone reductase (Na(+)-transporting) subunit B [Clostridium sp.]|nr:NADH:ubiquinone reductase (Na(+)-transporting) subunit B [Prevotella sp.]MCM1428271.1 NADH:ubiquinone reductase (Na(+)-transporting) subunit B [Clostridium sp.]MCM1474755.1 NADH:ubiquinone reductase (Na(+)-transporting) subunit B [Muribaculaceae bacterium]